MRLTHFGHACVLVETGSARLLFDPGTWSDGFADLTGLDAVVVTHQHKDHLDVDRFGPLVRANPAAAVLVDPGSLAAVEGLGIEARVTTVGDRLDVAGARLDVVGGEHAVIHPDLPGIPNCGYVVDDGAFYHPGDSLTVPDHDVDVLGVPTAAPWLKLSEAVEFFRAVAPRAAVPIHEAVLADTTMSYALLDGLKPDGSTFTVLDRAAATAV